MARIEAIRVAQDPAYAAGLSDADWRELSQDPEWQQLVAEQAETVAAVMAEHGHKISGANGNDPVAQVPAGPFKVIGQSYARMQGLGIVTDKGLYTENMRMPGMLFMRTLRSKYPHARLLKVDVSKAKALPGVVAVLTAADIPGRKDCGVHEIDWPVLCYDKVRYVGDAIALKVLRDSKELTLTITLEERK